jgi:hypothetical protein
MARIEGVRPTEPGDEYALYDEAPRVALNRALRVPSERRWRRPAP